MDRDEQLLTDRDVAVLLQVSRRTVARMVADDPEFPQPIKVGRSDRWILRDLRDWQTLQKLKRKAASVGPGRDTSRQDGTSRKPG